ncbi:unnamed protein product [Schistosoma margrebowiei]|uniref:Uncharacterized protein n=1 Tax=Schistosoma margrebowiei TaxID=48269 RepID=A0A183LXW9_9TREM|nr:unnamed protein product [Schistosoma margrebowiei]
MTTTIELYRQLYKLKDLFNMHEYATLYVYMSLNIRIE